MTAARGGGILLVLLNLRFNQYSSDLQFCYHYFKLIYLVNFEEVFKYCKYTSDRHYREKETETLQLLVYFLISHSKPYIYRLKNQWPENHYCAG